MTASAFSSIPQGKLANSGDSFPLGEVAVLSIVRSTSKKSGREYTSGAEIMLPDGTTKSVRVGGVVGKQLASLVSLPARVTVVQKVSATGNKYRSIIVAA